ncbi:hypothetical protein BT63DRAFT_422252 [Microthyrium microscopicum]|uniref:CBM-cenC domain-containing protein n=1 Tax=Microthyrium microscopicum TaxID=703497 RepID=A0A6A6ULE9_9PEZI|nr:hypothetical protein BT63DRAFT_422252 [Microthyrium microscopicum]
MKSFVITLLALCAAASPATSANKRCEVWCDNTNNPGSCTSQAKSGLGACYTCGPYKTLSSEKLCDGKCADTASDAKNCGSCGNGCGSKKICSAGKCVKSVASALPSSSLKVTSSKAGSSSSVKSISSPKASSSKAVSSVPASSVKSTSSVKSASSTKPVSSSKSTSSPKPTSSATSTLSGSTSSTSTTSSSTQICSPRGVPGRQFALLAQGGVGYKYTPPIADIVPQEPLETQSAVFNTALLACEELCKREDTCRTIHISNTTSSPYLTCGLNAEPFNNATDFTYDSTSTDPQYSWVYNVTNWLSPWRVIDDAQFETGCLPPWTEIQPLGPSGPAAIVQTCDNSTACGPYMARLAASQTTNAGNDFSLGIEQSPAVIGGVAYYLSASIKGTSGSLKLVNTADPSATQVFTPTGNWETIQMNFTGVVGQFIEFVAFDDTAFDWSIGNVLAVTQADYAAGGTCFGC